MYGWIWGRFPGPLPVRLLLLLVVLVVVVLVLFIFVFPALSPYLPFSNVTVSPSAGPTP